MNERELDDALIEVEKIAREAGATVLSGYRQPVTIRLKGEIDLVTEYDVRSEELIRGRLAAAFPGTSIVGEEGEQDDTADLVWYVDPIDGTTNFAHGHPYFGVSIALCRGREPLLGVVFAPALDVTWKARKGGGAMRNETPCKVSETNDMRKALCATGFPYDRHITKDDNLREWSAFIQRTVGIRRCGAAALDLAMVADGTYELFWEQKLKWWDMAAGILFVDEAGGFAMDYTGEPVDMRRGRVLATNAALRDVAIEIVTEARKGMDYWSQPPPA
ncbi:MAG: inositol monophosphatase [Deltaproteobacteria bacterium]|nr:inositol monophosphatase [Deltaproteobacteria bacterium]